MENLNLEFDNNINDKKPRNWTALLGVKIVCFVMIVVLAFLVLNRINAIVHRTGEIGLGVDIIMTDITPEQDLFNRHMHNASFFARQVLYFGSEESILAGEHLMWEYVDVRIARDVHNDVWVEEYMFEYLDELRYVEGRVVRSAALTTPSGMIQYAWLGWRVNTAERRAAEEQNAIRTQLEEFRRAMRVLEEIEGLKYFLSDMDGNVFANVGADRDWFLNQRVFLIAEPSGTFTLGTRCNETLDKIQVNWGGWGWEGLSWSPFLSDVIGQGDYTIYLAFTSDVVSAHRVTFLEARSAFIRDFAIIGIAIVLAIALFAILLTGAGRRFGIPKTEGVHFTTGDKPFLDVGLLLIAVWWVIWLNVSVGVLGNYWRSPGRNYIFTNIYLAVFAIAMVAPMLEWQISFVKRLKAGKFWRHTLIYYIPSKAMRLIRYLWNGFKLTPKVGIISAVAFFTLFFVGLVGGVTMHVGVIFIVSVMITGTIAFLLIRYARRLHALEQGARRTSEGAYDAMINVGEGEFGSIANSINNISAGINRAVEERMKSERLKAELITNVSHDLRTPLTSIISYTDLLKTEGLDNEKAPEYLDILVQKSQRLKTLTDELFEAAKASTGNIDVNITELDLVSLINQVLGELDGSVQSSGLEFRVALPESKHARADGRLMWRVFENLLSNIFKYSLPNSRVYVDISDEDRFVRVDMKNISGTELNIDPAELMDRFKRGDDSRADGGSGLGLSIVKSFVAAQGGIFHIAIDGDLFKASVFLPSV